MQRKRLPEPEERVKAGFARAALLLSYISCREEDAVLPGELAPLAKEPGRNGNGHDKSGPKGSMNPSAQACRDGMARHSTFCMDRFEAHLIYRESGQNHPYYIRPVDFSKVKAASAPGVFPQGYLSQTESATLCANAGKRLCTLAEWMEACTGRGKNRFAYGNSRGKNVCNSGRAPHVMSRYFGGNYEGHYWNNEQFNDPIINLTAGYLARTRSRPDCVSEEGVFDMVGNLHEWVSDVGRNGMGTFAGSCYSDNDLPCAYYAQVHAREYHDYSTGTRCCEDRRDGR